MINWIKKIGLEFRLKRYKKYIQGYIDTIKDMDERLEVYRKGNLSLSGRVKILEEQQEIMHNFLVEINKYLVNIADKKEIK